MNKEDFNNLELEQQVQYINECLQETSLVKACKAMGIDESTVRDRFNRNGYKRQDRDKDKYKRFIATGDTMNTNNTSTTGNTKVANKTNEKAREVKSKATNNKSLENRVNSLEKELEQLKAMILSNTSNITNTKDTININNTGIKKYDKENLVSRNYKIDEDVANEFVKFCKVQKLTNDYKVSDLATNALVEYMNKFNK